VVAHRVSRVNAVAGDPHESSFQLSPSLALILSQKSTALHDPGEPGFVPFPAGVALPDVLAL
jgi:hypothetical protein